LMAFNVSKMIHFFLILHHVQTVTGKGRRKSSSLPSSCHGCQLPRYPDRFLREGDAVF
jgi:hypothetical protein